MYCPNFVVSFVQFCSIFVCLRAFYGAAKRVLDVIDNNRKSVVRNCGMWVTVGKTVFPHSGPVYNPSKVEDRHISHHLITKCRLINTTLSQIAFKIASGALCEPFRGRFAAYLVQEVGEKRTFPGYECEENLLLPYAA